MPTIGKIKAELFGDTRHFDRSMRRSGQRVNRLTQQFHAFRGAILPITGAFGFGQLIRSTAQETERMAQLSRRLQTNVEAFSRLSRVLNRSGIGLNSTAMMMQRLQRRAADAADGNKQLAAAFGAIGVNLDAFQRLDPVEGFIQVAEALTKVETPAKRIQLAFKLLDSEGVALLQQKLPALRADMAKTTAITTEQAEKVEALAAAWTKLGESARSGAASVFAKLSEFTDSDKRRERMEASAARRHATRGSLGRIADWFRGESEEGFGLYAPRTGRIAGAPVAGSRRISLGDQSPIAAADARGGLLHGGGFGNLGPSDAILEQLRGIRANTETRGAILE